MVAFYLPGGIPVRSFALLTGAGAALGLAWVAWRAPDRQIGRALDAALWILLGALAGGRVGYVATNWAYFQHHLNESLRLYLGGMSLTGALLGGALLGLVVALWTRQAPGELADALLPLAAALAVSLWLACWVEGVAYGRPAESIFALPAGDEGGYTALRWPLQLAGAASALALFWLVDRLPIKWPAPGARAAACLALYGLIMLGLAPLRGDSPPAWLGFDSGAWAGLALLALALILLAALTLSKNRTQRNKPLPSNL